MLNDLAILFENSAHITEEMLVQWNAALEQKYPASDYGRCQLTLYKFSGVRTKHLFLDSFGHDEDELEAELSDDSPKDVLVGLLAHQ